MVTLENKKQIVEELVEKLKKANGIYFVDFAKITVEQISGIRRNFRKNDAEFKVAKNTLILRALKEVGLEIPEKMLFGQTGIVFSYDDAIAPAKVIKTHVDKENIMHLKAAFIEGQLFEGKQLDVIAKLPSRAELIAGILGSLNSPVSGIVGSLNAVIRDLASVIEEVAKTKAA